MIIIRVPSCRTRSRVGPGRVTPSPPPGPEPPKNIGAIGADSRNSAFFSVDRNFQKDTFSKERRFFETLHVCKSEKTSFDLPISWRARARTLGNLEVEILLCACRCRCLARISPWALSPHSIGQEPGKYRTRLPRNMSCWLMHLVALQLLYYLNYSCSSCLCAEQL